MGNNLRRALHVGRRVNGDCDIERRSPTHAGKGAVRMLICAMDYKGAGVPQLTCSADARNMVALAKACGVSDLTVKMDEECTLAAIRQAIVSVASRVQPDDFFIFYFAGHGFQVEDQDGDEDDGMDEAFVFLNDKGKVTKSSLLVDDEFAELLLRHVHPMARILVLADCCHSGTICDFDSRRDWDDREAVCISGCKDKEEAVDTEFGGVLTCSVLAAVAKLQQAGEPEYSVGRLFNLTLEADWEYLNKKGDKQHLAVSKAEGCDYNTVAWPLIPLQPYQVPLAVDLGQLDIDNLEPHCFGRFQRFF
mmetsp:Transcript_19566/g.45489  ORF Transcript_19566/g.45489 Transcript_19566/m.45489 type:complete len:306 (-) Transcript_19566:29-946(-)